MIIGKFTSNKTDGFAGNLITLTHRGRLVFTPAEKGADYQVTLDGIEVGAPWSKTGRESGKTYLSVKLDSRLWRHSAQGLHPLWRIDRTNNQDNVRPAGQ
jgi:uncharacterized protein (DUF736 family)